MSVLEKLRALESAKSADAQKAYDALVVRMEAGNDDPDLAEVQRVLADAGKTSSDLISDVSRLRRRNDLRAKIAELHAGRLKRVEIHQQIAELDAAWTKAHEAHLAAVHPLQMQLADLNQAEIVGSNYERDLRESCKNETVLSRIRMNQRETSSTVARLDAANRTLEAAETSLKREQRRVNPRKAAEQHGWLAEGEALGGGDVAVAQLQCRVEQCKAAVKALESQRDALAAESKELHKQTLEG